MSYAELVVFILTCYCCQGFLHHRHGLNFLLEKLNIPDTISRSSAVETQWIEQPLDHFDKKETRKLNMRYFQRQDTWKPNGPIYLFINGEEEAHDTFIQTGMMSELAEETHGAMFLSEHRYYGESQPFKDLTTENLKYLSARQALADNARLLLKIKAIPQFKSSKVVVVGGSYAGNLAAWMKLLYPDLVDAAIASSAPVLAKADFFEYLETVSDDFEHFGTPGCFGNISKKFERYEDLMKTDDGIKLLKEEENICEESDMHKPENQQLFFLLKANNYKSLAQYGDVGEIKSYCEEFNKPWSVSSKDYEPRTWMKQKQCYDINFDSFKNMNETVGSSWDYQTCTEFGYFQTSNSNNKMFKFNIPVDYFIKICQMLFGADFDEKRVAKGVRMSNEMYEGLHPNVTNVVFVNGALDPWHRLSVLEDLSNDTPTILIPFSSHCRDLFPDNSTDPKELREARKNVKKLIKKWIGAEEFVKVNT